MNKELEKLRLLKFPISVFKTAMALDMELPQARRFMTKCIGLGYLHKILKNEYWPTRKLANNWEEEEG